MAHLRLRNQAGETVEIVLSLSCVAEKYLDSTTRFLAFVMSISPALERIPIPEFMFAQPDFYKHDRNSRVRVRLPQQNPKPQTLPLEQPPTLSDEQAARWAKVIDASGVLNETVVNSDQKGDQPLCVVKMRNTNWQVREGLFGLTLTRGNDRLKTSDLTEQERDFVNREFRIFKDHIKSKPV